MKVAATLLAAQVMRNIGNGAQRIGLCLLLSSYLLLLKLVNSIQSSTIFNIHFGLLNCETLQKTILIIQQLL